MLWLLPLFGQYRWNVIQIIAHKNSLLFHFVQIAFHHSLDSIIATRCIAIAAQTQKKHNQRMKNTQYQPKVNYSNYAPYVYVTRFDTILFCTIFDVCFCCRRHRCCGCCCWCCCCVHCFSFWAVGENSLNVPNRLHETFPIVVECNHWNWISFENIFNASVCWCYWLKCFLFVCFISFAIVSVSFDGIVKHHVTSYPITSHRYRCMMCASKCLHHTNLLFQMHFEHWRRRQIEFKFRCTQNSLCFSINKYGTCL